MNPKVGTLVKKTNFLRKQVKPAFDGSATKPTNDLQLRLPNDAAHLTCGHTPTLYTINAGVNNSSSPVNSVNCTANTSPINDPATRNTSKSNHIDKHNDESILQT